MIRTELVGLGLAVSLIVVVVAIATSDISSLSNPDYLGAVPGTLSGALRNSTYIATAYVRLHGFPKSLGNIIKMTDWLTILREYELIVAGVLLLLIFILTRRDRRRELIDAIRPAPASGSASCSTLPVLG